MKFPSVSYLITQATATLARFYMPLCFAIFGTTFAILQVDNYNETNTRLICTCIIGISLSLGSTLLVERWGKPRMQWLASALCLLAAAAYWQWLAPHEPFDDIIPTITFVVLAIVMHLFVAVGPYLRRNEPIAFWRYNETLYTRMLLSAVFSAVLFIGVGLAITACDKLFNIDINDHIYPKLWVIIVGVFNTWFFLAGIPAHYDELNEEKTFPKSLKIFTQYILIPLVVLYMVILYAYGIKILIQWSLPHGWVSTLVLGYAVVGVLAILLVTPLRDSEDAPWVRFFSRFFFVATLPLIVLLYVAIIVRIRGYGITEPRYFLLLMGAWLGFISLYFIFSAKKNIKVVPASLAVIGLLSLAGPWGAFATSQRSQLHRLESILIKNKMWEPGGKIHATATNMPASDADDAYSIVKYFVDREKATSLRHFVTANIDSAIAASHYDKDSVKMNGWEIKNKLTKEMATLFHASDIDLTQGWNARFGIDDNTGINISGYSKSFNVNFYSYDQKKRRLYISPENYFDIGMDEKDGHIRITCSHGDSLIEAIAISPLLNILHTYPRDITDKVLTQQQMTLDGTGPLKPRIIIRSISLENGVKEENLKDIYNLDATVLIR